jgi:hypothetical protein
MRYYLLFFLTFIHFLVSFGQRGAGQLFEGTIIDALDGKPISMASVYLQNHDHIGVYADEMGAFALPIPKFIENDIVVISALGYEKKMIRLERTGNSTMGLTLSLQPMPIILDEVLVSAKSRNLEQLCREALRFLPRNYPNKHHYLTGFYRKVSTDSSQYTGLVEAVIGVHDPGYQKASEEIQIEVLQVRAGDNALKTDTLAMLVGNIMSEQYQVSAAKSLQRFYESDLIRLYSKPYTLFNSQGRLFVFGDHENGIIEKAELTDVTIENGDTIVHIRSESSVSGVQLDNINVSINISDKAIVEFTRGMFEDHVNVKFRKLSDGRYYPYYIRLVTPVLFHASKTTKYYDIETLEVDIIEIDRRQIPKARNIENPKVSFEPAKYQYDSVFWAEYIGKYPRLLDDDVLRSLEKVRSLPEQFKDKQSK